MSNIDKISSLVANQFPSFFKEEGPMFLSFMEAYYEYMEQQGKMSDAIRNLKSYQDISTTTDEYIDYFFDTFLPSVPRNVVADKKLMVKYINEFNQSRGTLASYKLLFRALYNEDIEVSYPSEQILKVSDGDWRLDRYITTKHNKKNFDFIGKTIVGVSSGAEALVENVFRRQVNGTDLNQLILSNIAGKFKNREFIKIKGESNLTAYTALINAGIESLEIITPGAGYEPGDIVKLISNKVGEFGKVVVTDTQDLGGVVVFEIEDGGSGYTSSTNGDTRVNVFGGDGSQPASLQISDSDLGDIFGLTLNINFLSDYTNYANNAPRVQYRNGSYGIMNTFANTILGSPTYGFPEDGESRDPVDYRDQIGAKLILNCPSDPGFNSLATSNSIFGVVDANTGLAANGQVVSILDDYDAVTDLITLKVNGFQRFYNGDNVTFEGSVIGTVDSYYANTVGPQPLWVGITDGSSTISEGDELVSANGAYGVVKVINDYDATGYENDKPLYKVVVGANNSANVSNQFSCGPLKSFRKDEEIRKQGSAAVIGKAVFQTSNTEYENIYTKLEDSLIYDAKSIGTISKISLPISGSGYSIAPQVTVRENNVASLGIGEQYITLKSSDKFWGTGTNKDGKIVSMTDGVIVGDGDCTFLADYPVNSYICFTYDGESYELKVTSRTDDNQITVDGYDGENFSLQPIDYIDHLRKDELMDTNDKIVSSDGKATGHIVGGAEPNLAPGANVTRRTFGSIFAALGVSAVSTYNITLRVWQDPKQRFPNNIQYEVGDTVTIEIYDESLDQFNAPDTRTIVNTGTATIHSIQDEGILGDNASINATIGADGTISKVKIFDSGFSYDDQEVVTLETPSRDRSSSGQLKLTLNNAANSEGYYATTRSQLDTLRGYIQDSNYYQEYSYEIISPLSLKTYRDYALELVHPSGQALFGKYRTSSSSVLDASSNSDFSKYTKIDGTVSLAEDISTVTVDVSTLNIDTDTYVSSELSSDGDTLTVTLSDSSTVTIDVSTLNIVTNTYVSSGSVSSDGNTLTLTLYNNSTLTGSSTTFKSIEFDGYIIIDHPTKGLYKLPINSVDSDTQIILSVRWNETDISDRDAYYISGNINGDV